MDATGHRPWAPVGLRIGEFCALAVRSGSSSSAETVRPAASWLCRLQPAYATGFSTPGLVTGLGVEGFQVPPLRATRLSTWRVSLPLPFPNSTNVPSPPAL